MLIHSLKYNTNFKSLKIYELAFSWVIFLILMSSLPKKILKSKGQEQKLMNQKREGQ